MGPVPGVEVSELPDGGVGDLRERGAVAAPAVGVDRIGPHGCRDRADRGALPIHYRPPHREAAAHRLLAEGTDVGEELLSAAGGVCADQDLGAVTVLVGYLSERGIDDGDVVHR